MMSTRTKQVKRRSIFIRLLLPMLLVAVAEMAALFVMLSVGGAFTTLQKNALDTLDERTQNKQQPFEDDLLHLWDEMANVSTELTEIIQARLQLEGANASAIRTDAGLNAAIVEDASTFLISEFRALETTGMFFILDGQGVAGQKDSYAGIHLRDFDPTSDASNNRDLLLLRGLPPLSSKLDVPLDTAWQAAFTFSRELNTDYYFKPLEAARQGTSTQARYYGYWAMPLRMTAEDTDSVLTYSLPVFAASGDVLGVVGIELSSEYLSGLLNEGEFARRVPGCYVLGTMAENTIRIGVTSGQTYKQHFRQDQTTMTIDEWADGNSVSFMGPRSGKRVYGTVIDMNLYPTTTAYSGEKWVLIGLQSEESLLTFSRHFTTLMIVGGVTSMLMCLGVAIITSRGMTQPILRMVEQVRRRSEMAELTITPTGMVEIDELGESIQRLSRDVYESASRLSTILQLTGMAVGVFEIKRESNIAYCSSGFFQLLDCEDVAHDGETLPKTTLYRIMREKLTDQVDEDVWLLRSRTGRERYIRRVQLQHRYSLLGAVMDVTSEMEDRRRIEHERDYDILTGLLNRRAFSRITEELFTRRRDQLKVGAILMMDLDNLKFVNDTYGHDCGDNYIQSFARALAENANLGHAVCGRRSGDEFYVLLYGFDSKEECRAVISEGWHRIMEQGIQLPDGSFYRFRCSGGVAWYPDDATDLKTLIHYADFAMYKVKQGSKGVLDYFDREVYTEDAYLINAREALNQMIEKQLAHFAFQPIVDARTGQLFGYEMLMRPDVPELRNPMAVMRLAKAQGLLHHIERLTWYGTLRAVRIMRDRGLLSPNARIFINSIANQVLDPEEEEYVVEHFGDLLPNVVLEVTESEDNNMAYTRRKLSFIRSHGGQVAIDDYGTGYNSEMALMLIDADIVKVDISFVRDVDSDQDKQALVKNLISYARRKDIAVLSEGVETRSEMETLVAFGMDYMQGYYLGRPQDEPADIPQSVREEIAAALREYALARVREENN
ncbi:MAG: EAL domain-containing protein [Clostridia bacterium]|nr:EAL domain-containing protein [Clostridia bacterium]